MNTHANPDHCFGNELLPAAAEIYASATTASEMGDVSPELLHTLQGADLLPDLRAFVDVAFGPFDFSNITLRPPTRTFSGQLDVAVGDRVVSLIELGPAHTGGDTIVHVPDAGAVFTGDLLFIDGTPVVWADLDNWLAACDRILELDASVLVPGHGPVTDAGGVRDVQRYLRFVRDEARARFDSGLDPAAAADDIDLSDFADWGDPERIVANVHAAYRAFDPSLRAPPAAEQLVAMAGWRARH
jgi:glyoxylase-like metal-dependent hydrolase (beta-lactamase superfamily II)